MDRQLLRVLEHDPLLAARVERLMTIPAVGTVLALTWALSARQNHVDGQLEPYKKGTSDFILTLRLAIAVARLQSKHR